MPLAMAVQDGMFQSAPPVKGATLMPKDNSWPKSVSIRAPREGGDQQTLTMSQPMKVSIRAPREGGDDIRGVDSLRR